MEKYSLICFVCKKQVCLACQTQGICKDCYGSLTPDEKKNVDNILSKEKEQEENAALLCILVFTILAIGVIIYLLIIEYGPFEVDYDFLNTVLISIVVGVILIMIVP